MSVGSETKKDEKAKYGDKTLEMHLRPVKQSALTSSVHAGKIRDFVTLEQMQNLHLFEIELGVY